MNGQLPSPRGLTEAEDTLQDATEGVLVTMSQLVSSAKSFVSRIPQRQILIDGTELTRLMVCYGVGVRVERTIEIKRLDLDYFGEEES